MKTLIFVNGPSGIGKTTLSEVLHSRLIGSAWIQSEWCRATNPFVYSAEMEVLTERNITFLLRSYLGCSELRYVILTWGLHGPRRAIFERVMQNISDIDHQFVPVTLTCSEEEHLRRLMRDRRDSGRIRSNLSARPFYESLPYPVLDTTSLTVQETADIVIGKVGPVAADAAAEC